jgi:NADPH:quinone reductase
MKAVICSAYGGTETLEQRDVDTPTPGPGEVLTRVIATSINPVDTQARRGWFPDWFPVPCILGLDVSGVVEAVGPGVERFKVGDEVFYMASLGTSGTSAEYHVAREELIAAKPKNLSHTEAAAVPLAGQTAWDALYAKGRLRAGESCLIHAGAGGVGHFAVQFAKAAGCHVFATCRGANRDFVESLGADRAIDYAAEDYRSVVMDETGGAGVDLVLESIGQDFIEQAFGVLKPGGRVVSIHIQEQPQSLFAGFLKNASLHLIALQPTGAILGDLATMIERGQVAPHLEATFSLAEISAAHERVEAGGVRGKVVVEI